MALDFPTATSVGQIHNQNGYRFSWDGSKWKSVQLGDISTSEITTPQTLTSNKTIQTNNNVAMIGPTVTLASGVIIDIGANSILTLLR